eukprot:CAMPEP_0176488992 /NCGR_PEP_ID=MMETSP0200_2-20121128/7031_1 /TAXON_ID=947934 /ORGANISM="Chaetoceros sp., Strain GSL56" /LENGTH=379 /DNA_ID=CAMNT_0017886065 /DNA_START=907 /DNA_END=2046 /DNA_ORIENTATION=+
MSSILNIINNPAPDDTFNRKKLAKQSLIEFCATTVFIYFGTLSAISTGTKLGDGTGIGQDVARIMPIAFTFGITIMCLAYSIGHITGGHMNPGVSFLMFLHRQISFTKMIFYWMAQFSGSIVASALVWGSTSNLGEVSYGGGSNSDGASLMYPNTPFLLGSTTLNDKISVGNGFLLETMGSFFFYFVISQTALDERGIAKSKFPAIPIGFSLVVVHICLIPFTGCGVNPARTFGPAVMTCMVASANGVAGDCEAAIGDFWWIYYVGPLMAALLVVEVSSLMHWDVEGIATMVSSAEQQGDMDAGNKMLNYDAAKHEDDFDDEEEGVVLECDHHQQQQQMSRKKVNKNEEEVLLYAANAEDCDVGHRGAVIGNSSASPSY